MTTGIHRLMILAVIVATAAIASAQTAYETSDENPNTGRYPDRKLLELLKMRNRHSPKRILTRTAHSSPHSMTCGPIRCRPNQNPNHSDFFR